MEELIGELFAMDDLTGGGPVAGQSNWTDQQARYRAFVGAANKFAGNEKVIDKNLFRRSLFHTGKMDNEALQKANAGVPAARRKAVKKLKRFFSQDDDRP